MDRPEIYARSLWHLLSPIQSLLNDKSVTEIMIVGRRAVYCERRGQVSPTDCQFPDDAALSALAQNVAEYVDRPLDERHPSLDGRLPDGSRVHVILPPASRSGICISIRRFQHHHLGLGDLVQCGTLSPQAAEFLEIAVECGRNMVISGGTGTGKTSLLNALSAAIPESERIIVIEDTAELRLHQAHTVYLEAQPEAGQGRAAIPVRRLFKDSLRMRPDRILVGEVRGGEALDLIQSMISGHAGSLTTVHANSPRDAASRLETLCLQSDASLPIYVARAQVASALHLVVQIQRLKDGSRRVQAISECLGLDAQQQYVWGDLFRFDGHGADAEGRIHGSMQPTQRRPGFADYVLSMGYAQRVRLTRAQFAAREPANATAPQALDNTSFEMGVSAATRVAQLNR